MTGGQLSGFGVRLFLTAAEPTFSGERSVRVTRARHPLAGHQLRVLGRMRRHGRLELLVVLPDGSKSLLPAAWTDHEPSPAAASDPRRRRARGRRRWGRWPIWTTPRRWWPALLAE